jgi:hypothetical protein
MSISNTLTYNSIQLIIEHGCDVWGIPLVNEKTIDNIEKLYNDKKILMGHYVKFINSHWTKQSLAQASGRSRYLYM